MILEEGNRLEPLDFLAVAVAAMAEQAETVDIIAAVAAAGIVAKEEAAASVEIMAAAAEAAAMAEQAETEAEEQARLTAAAAGVVVFSLMAAKVDKAPTVQEVGLFQAAVAAAGLRDFLVLPVAMAPASSSIRKLVTLSDV